MQKAEKYLEKIIEATTEEHAVDILVEIAKDLGIDHSYSGLVLAKDQLKTYQEAFKRTRARVTSANVPSMELLLDVRREVSFAYNELVDNLSSDINSAKLQFGEDARKIVKGESLIQVMNDEALKEKIKSKSATSLKELIGTTDGYVAWLNCHKLSYANWNTFRGMLDSWKMYSDYLAAAIRHEATIKITDVK